MENAPDTILSEIIAREKLSLERFLEKHDLTPCRSPWEYEIIFADMLFGFLSDGRLNPDKRQITIYGRESVRFIIHEWTHAAFPNFDCDRHAEGLAYYVQKQASTQGFDFFGWESTAEFVSAYLAADNREVVEDWYGFLQCGSNFYDSRWGRLLIARALSAEFVSFLIGAEGLAGYLDRYYGVIRENGRASDSEVQAFSEFINTRFSGPVQHDVLRDFFDVKASIAHELAGYDLPERGSILKYLNNKADSLGTDADVEKIRELALADLRMTISPKNQELWEMPSG